MRPTAPHYLAATQRLYGGFTEWLEEVPIPIPKCYTKGLKYSCFMLVEWASPFHCVCSLARYMCTSFNLAIMAKNSSKDVVTWTPAQARNAHSHPGFWTGFHSLCYCVFTAILAVLAR